MRTPEEIAHLYQQRRSQAGPDRQRMRDIRSLYQGDIAIPLPEMQRDERTTVVNFARMGINQLGMRTASVMPVVDPVVVDFGNREQARKRADLRRKVNHGWWGRNRLNLQMRHRARAMFAYASSPTTILPDFKPGSPTFEMPIWSPRSPLDTFASRPSGMHDFCPTDVIFAQTRTVGWVRLNYPEHSAYFHNNDPDDVVELLEYMDYDEFQIVMTIRARKLWDVADAIAPGGGNPLQSYTGGTAGVSLAQRTHRLGRTPCVIAGNISLERRVGQYDGIVGMYQAQAELQALGLIAKKKAVFQQEWLVAKDPNEMPEVLVQADGMTGVVGIVRGGVFDRVTIDPQNMNDNAIDRMERAQRVEAGIPASVSGEAPASVRTGRTLSGLIEAAVDPLVQEAHEIFAASLYEENKIAIAIDKAYWGNETKNFYVAFNGDRTHVTYTPDRIWTETDEHLVRYPLPGADLQDVTIATGQAMGAGMMSRRSAARLNPIIENPEVEHDQIVYERIEDATFQALLASAQQPGSGLELPDLARLAQLVRDDDMDVFDAIAQIHKEAQARQATPAPTPAEQQPGITPPGAGQEQPPGQFQVRPDQQGLSDLLTSLTGPLRSGRLIRNAPAPALQGGGGSGVA
jgi:hypothetical protein